MTVSKYFAWGLISLGILGLVVSGFLLFYKPKKHLPPAPSGVSAVTPTQATETAPPTQAQVKTYTTAADLPKYIDIPAIGVKQARILHYGLLANGEIATPTNTADTGWYQQSAKPGAVGAMFIFGHVSSTSDNGVFHNLKKLKPGDDIYITRGDNTTYNYVVKNSTSVPVAQVDMSKVLMPVDPNNPGLNLMTCDGKYVKDTQSFTNRLIVSASLLKS